MARKFWKKRKEKNISLNINVTETQLWYQSHRRTMITFTCIFVSITLILSGLSTLFLTMSLLSNEWEYITYKKDVVRDIAQAKNHSMLWMEGTLARLEVDDPSLDPKNASHKGHEKIAVFLVPAFGGVNNLCIDVTEAGKIVMKDDGFDIGDCISYLSNEQIMSKDAWLDRMRNLAMSCAMVCLILLASSAPLGLLGLIKKQISTIMVTGVMYILAAVFGIFTLAFMHFKRVKPEGYYTSTVLDKDVPEEYMKARVFTVGWPPSIEWAGLCLCVIGSLFWLLLAKIFRFQILSPT